LAPRELDTVFVGGRQAGCVGLLAASAAGCNALAVVAYDDLVGEVAATLGILLLESIRGEDARDVLQRSDLLISVHGRELVPDELLRLPRLGGINVHPCLYAYKGANPVGRLLADGNPKASVGVHRMTSELDRGDVLVEEFVDVSEEISIEGVYNRLYPHYATALVRAIATLRTA
jgi:methionyl-tRNA formyltransferase